MEPGGDGVASDHRERIVQDPVIVGGEAVIRGTRVTVRTVLASLAEGAPVEEILRDFPTLTADDVRAAIAFGTASAQEEPPPAATHVKR